MAYVNFPPTDVSTTPSREPQGEQEDAPAPQLSCSSTFWGALRLPSTASETEGSAEYHKGEETYRNIAT